MTDLAGIALRAVGARSLAALPMLFFAGLITSVGPCMAPRYVAVAAFAQRAGYWRAVLPFMSGIATAYIVIGLTAGALSMVRSASQFIDILLAVGLGLSGLLFLLGDPTHCHKHVPVRSASPAASYLLGLGSSLVVSPCCTPVIAAISNLTLPSGQPFLGIALTLAFAAGHMLPIVGTTFFSARVPSFVTRGATVPVASIIAGTLMLGLAAFYGVLA